MRRLQKCFLPFLFAFLLFFGIACPVRAEESAGFRLIAREKKAGTEITVYYDDESPAPGAFTMTLFYEGTAENIRSFHSSLAKRFLSYELSEDKLILLFCDVTGELDLKDGEIGALFLDVPPEELVERLSVHFDGVCDRNGRELPAVYSVEYPAENGTSSSLRDKGETQDSSLDGSEGEKPGEGSKSPWGIFQVKKNQFLIFCLAIALFFLLWYLFKRKKKKELSDAQKKDSGPPSKGCG